MPVCTELLLTMDGGNPDYTLPLDMHTCYLESISGWCAHNGQKGECRPLDTGGRGSCCSGVLTEETQRQTRA